MIFIKTFHCTSIIVNRFTEGVRKYEIAVLQILIRDEIDLPKQPVSRTRIKIVSTSMFILSYEVLGKEIKKNPGLPL